MKDKTINTEQGHWVLANLGKKVLRPGGRELTSKLVEELKITPQDSVVEFAPGMGYTASMLLKKDPKQYTGIELNKEAANRLTAKFHSENYHIINTTAAKTGLADAATDKVIGEAMLTMQADRRKAEIIKEAFRILKKGGRYGIHELGLMPDDLDAGVKENIQKSLAKVIKVNARPLTQKEWCTLLKNEGFKIKEVYASPMQLLEPNRMIQDEGILGALKIGFNLFTHPKAKKKVMAMRKIFRKYENQLIAFAIIAEK